MAGRISQGFAAYLILQVPGILLAGLIFIVAHPWAGRPPSWAIGLFLLWVAKDVAVYLVLREVFAPPHLGPEPLIGTPAVTQDRLAPTGCVRVGGELWTAEALRADEPIAARRNVVARERRGLTLVAEAQDGAEGSNEAPRSCARGGERSGSWP